MGAGNPELEAALLAHREDPKLWSIYGDWLEAAGDPRGELVGLMLAREQNPAPQLAKAERAFLETHQQWLLGPGLRNKAFEATLSWRRGFLIDAAADAGHAGSFGELLEHPSARFVERVRLEADSESWPEWAARLETAAPGWRFVQLHAENLDNEDALRRVLALPHLEELVISYPHDRPLPADWSKATRLRRVRLEGASARTLEELVAAPPPLLEQLRLVTFQAGAQALLQANDWWSRLELFAIHEEGNWSVSSLAQGKRPARVVVRCSVDDPARTELARLPNVIVPPWDEPLETAFVLIDRPALEGDERLALVNLARTSGAKRLVAYLAPMRLRDRVVTICRLHSDVEGTVLSPIIVAQELSRRIAGLRTASFTLSESNDLARGIGFGVPRAEKPSERARAGRLMRVELAAAFKTSVSFYQRHALGQQVLDRLLGFDPGEDALARLLRASEEAEPLALIGAALVRGEAPPPLLTETAAEPQVDEAYDEDEEDEEGDYDDYEDDPPVSDETVPEEEAVELSAIDVPAALVARVLAPPPADPDEEEPPDEDEQVPDAVDATPEEIWAESPVDPDEDWEEPRTGESEQQPLDPDQILAGQIEPLVTHCSRCARAATTVACRVCHEEVCEQCCLPIELFIEGAGAACRPCMAG